MKILIISIIIVLVIILPILYFYINSNSIFYKSKIVKTNNYISTRTDAYGANAMPYISFIYLCNISNVNLYHNCNEHCERFKNNIMHQYLVSKTKQTKDDKLIKNDINLKFPIWSPNQICNEIYLKTGQPFPDIFYNSKIFHELRNLYISKYTNSPIKYEDATIIHVRLDDVYNNNNHFQSFIGEENLILLINFLLKKFGEPIYIITGAYMSAPNDRDRTICYDCLKKSKYELDDYYKNIIGSDDLDYDFYSMMTCRNLIIGGSTFPFIPSILQKNIVYTYEDWEHYRDIIGGDTESWKIKVLNYK